MLQEARFIAIFYYFYLVVALALEFSLFHLPWSCPASNWTLLIMWSALDKTKY